MFVFLYYLLIVFLSFFFILLFVAFFILSERKILGYIQLRKGPNKVGLLGLLQSFSDFLKLLSKLHVLCVRSRSWFIYLGLFFLILCSLCYVCLYSFCYSGSDSISWFLWFLIVSSLVSYCFLCIGWGSYSKYAMVGSLRFAFSSVSFEACLMCIVIVYSLTVGDYSVNSMLSFSWFLLLSLPLCYFIWLLSVLCESSRTPFDFGESESELVSGLNVEYSGLPFICLFACEYLMMFIFSWLTSLIFFGGLGFIYLFSLFHVLVLIWCRAVLPRIRFDFFVSFMWEFCLVLLLFSVLIVF